MRYMMLLSGTSPSTPPPPELFEAIMKLGGRPPKRAFCWTPLACCRARLAPGWPWPEARSR